MSFSTADCKGLLAQDAGLAAQGLAKANWKRVSKKNGAHGPERVFSCSKPFAHHALVVENPAGLWIASDSSNADHLSDASIWRANPFSAPGAAVSATAAASASQAAASPQPAALGAAAPNWRENPIETDRMKGKAARSLADKIVRQETGADRIAALAAKGLGIAIANEFLFAVSAAPSAGGATRFGAIVVAREQWERELAVAEAALPLEALFPLGTWARKNGRFELPGVFGASAASVIEEMISRGFSFSDELQASAAPEAEACLAAHREADRLAAAKSEPKPGALASWREGPSCSDAEAIETAKELVGALCGDDGLDMDHEEAFSQIESVGSASVALALKNQLAFIIHEDELFGNGDRTLGAVFYPAGRSLDDFEDGPHFPIRALLPDTADDLNEESEWVFPGYPGNAVGLVRDLISRGFRFDDKTQLAGDPQISALLQPLWDADALAREAQAGAGAAAQASGHSWRQGPKASAADFSRAKNLVAAITGVGASAEADDGEEAEEAAEADHDDAWETISEWSQKGGALALANQFSFFVERQEVFGQEWPVAIVTPTEYSRAENAVYDQECPIGGLLPGNADDLNGCGTWFLEGYTGSLPELVHEMIARGFTFHEEFQRRWGEDFVDELQPLWDADALQKQMGAPCASAIGRAPKRRL